MADYIENTNYLDNDYINSIKWEVIKLNVKADTRQLAEYLNLITTQFDHFKFDFNNPEYLTDEVYNKFKTDNRVTNYIGNIAGWTLAWPIDRDIPLASQSHMKPELFPELKDYDLYYDSKIMKRYQTGYMLEIEEKLTIRALRQAILTKHLPGVKTLTHVDSQRIKLHIPMQSTEGAVFHFGENGERKYFMEVGNLYLINPAVPHGTDNLSNQDRYHLISRVDLDWVPYMLSLSGTL